MEELKKEVGEGVVGVLKLGGVGGKKMGKV